MLENLAKLSNILIAVKPFFDVTENQDKNLNILRTRRAFKMKQKAFFIIFKKLSIAKSCLRLKSAPLNMWQCNV